MRSRLSLTAFRKLSFWCRLALGVLIVVGALSMAWGDRARAQEGVADLVGMQEYVYGFPLVMIQATSPGTDKESNGLPCQPARLFNLTVRSYQPGESFLNGSYVLPPVEPA